MQRRPPPPPEWAFARSTDNKVGHSVLASEVDEGSCHFLPLEHDDHASHTATVGLTPNLFLIGAGLSARTLRTVGWRPLLQGMLLWVFISVPSLGIIMRFV